MTRVKKMTAAEVAKAVDGILEADGTIVVSAVSTDTRVLTPGSLFVAICGPRYDGHDYVQAARDKGAVLVLAKQGVALPDGVPCVRVADTVAALGALATWHRSRFTMPIIAVTGSVGKTSTREMIAAALSAKYHVLRSKSNFNNEIGLPLSVLEMDETHTAAVFELGMRGLGEIGYLSRIVRPDVAVITNIGLSHIEKLGSRQNILRAKLEIIEGMGPEGVVILNGEDELLKGLRGLLRFKTLYYGMDEATDIQGYEAASLGENGMAFKTSIAGQDGSFTIRAPGMHSVSNALAALAVCTVLGLRQSEAEEGLTRYAGQKLRMHIEERNGIRIINDSYNAAPASMKAALAVLSELGSGKRTVAILGDMLELGDWSRDAHLDVGRQAGTSKLGLLFGIGVQAKGYLAGALEMGMKRESMAHFETVEDAIGTLSDCLEKGDTVLFKASRGLHLERVIEQLFPADHTQHNQPGAGDSGGA